MSQPDPTRNALESLAGLWPRLLSLSLESVQDFVEQATEIVSPAFRIPALPRMPRMGDCCEIPETECPPRCVCDVTWKGCPGQRLSGTIRLTNTSGQERLFELEATPFSGPSAVHTRIAVEPAQLPLSPGATALAEVTFTVPERLAPGAYTAEILVRGSWEQCVWVRLEVAAERDWHCEVRQGESPVRVRAHRWYDHFQCVERCAPGSDRLPTVTMRHDEAGRP
jgi:hypothetical protein